MAKRDRSDLNSRYERLSLLYQVSNVIHSTLDSKEALGLIVREAVRVMRASSGSLVLINPTTNILEIEAEHGLPAGAVALKLRVGQGITGWVAKAGRPARVGNVQSDPRYIMVRPNTRSELAVPLEVNGVVRGVLNVDSDREQAFSADDETLLQELAIQAAKVIQNTWLYEQLRLKARLFEALFKVGQAINSAVSLDEALTVITREACLLMEAKMSSLLLLDDSGEWLDLRASSGAGPAYLSKPRLNASESLVGIVVRRKKPVADENVQISSRYQNIEIAQREGLKSLLSVPLVFREEAIGVLNVYKADPYSFSNEEIRILTALAELSAIAIEKARLYERLVVMEEQLRQTEKLTAIGLLAAEVAHEIRNPLTVMKMLYHSMDLRFPAEDPRHKDDMVMREKMDHLNKIVEQVLDLARSNEPHPEPVNVNRLLDGLSLLIRHKLTQAQVELVRKEQSDLPMIHADPTHLEQAFLNLILNAVEAMPNGGTLTISTRAVRIARRSADLAYVAIQFRDTGQGMSEEQRRRAFSSLLSSNKQKGTGLGLAIVARVVEEHRGKLKITSRQGKGTAIEVLLPVSE